ncbi:PTS-dependent dihydroxyacetone kinase phosphotransferase subunit DhaM [Clostridium baratii]|uniref:dihydroxyacetone kinase phosphoryl donor subunit DhaM n=1 Tax=Clostridium baratii TaxID=1561 RepID=UPI0009A422A2|nr:dihydroxyacetone kinase phosphoryl donor subunit DhaM [Clostridium baratii]OPF51234.1 PTS mannose transporter subunit IID [Clostridium baratii]OPF55689.1 PTS-dependent dihydroxyacetone kinase phosphotransferase subunit DhaM [Clostridium baratii]OPF56931.1 PTS-dependent dihydroxyacetone kinase phosphotransferase subunit DhaM [Clostridium baratii]OPF59930.1 PTS-dependent dihydroxyacetone kinase phosphotransferase subunit DhaM [Clostridium baratii]
MVGIVIISHSNKIAEGVTEMALQMAPEVPIIPAGGTKDNEIGTDINKISDAIKKVYSDDGVMILFDLGSAYMNAQMAIDFLEEDIDINKVQIIDCALIEGAIAAAVQSGIGSNIEEIKEALKDLRIEKIS